MSANSEKQKVEIDLAERFDVRLAGLGGQGLLLAGEILGEAAAVHDGKNTVQTVSYAPLARGAPSRSEVVISDGPIYFPEVEDADVLLALSQDAYDHFKGRIKPGGIIIVDSMNVCPDKSQHVKVYPISKMARLETGRTITGSMVGLGLISNLTGRVSEYALKEAIRTHAPRGTVEINLRALRAGLRPDSYL